MSLAPTSGERKISEGKEAQGDAMIWMTKDWTQGESNALVKKLGGDKVARGILNDTVKFTVVEVSAPSLPPLLIPRGTVTVTLKERHNPDRFYQTRSDLFVQPDFRTQIVAKANLSEAGASFNLKYADLGRNAVDREIEEKLGKGHIWSETQICAIVADFIDKQPKGEDGTLLNGGAANLFYTSSCVVDVRWYADDREWDVNVWSRGNDRWNADSRVFSPATDPLSA
jgi:hypothetical protein